MPSLLDLLALSNTLGLIALAGAVCLVAIHLLIVAVLQPSFRQQFLSWPPQIRIRLLWLTVSGPFIAGALSSFAVLNSGANTNTAIAFFHWHHLGYEFDWHTLSGLSLIVLAVVLACRKTRQYQAMKRTSCLLEEQSHTIPIAYCSGLFIPKLTLSHALKAQLNKEELSIVRLHEQAHINQRDPLCRFIFEGFSSCFLPPAKKLLTQQFYLATEQRADRYAQEQHEPLSIAETLIKVTRIQSGNQALSSDICQFGQEHIEARVRALIAPPIPNHLSLKAAICGGIIFSTVLGLSASIDLIHHTSESLLF